MFSLINLIFFNKLADHNEASHFSVFLLEPGSAGDFFIPVIENFFL